MTDFLLPHLSCLSKDLRFDELRKALESYGYEMKVPKGGSSHYTFRKEGCRPITIPKPAQITGGAFQKRGNQHCVYLLSKNDAMYVEK